MMPGAMSGVVIREIAAQDADIRLDRWFRRHYPQLGHGRLEKLLRTGQVRVDGGRAKASTRLATGQKVRVPPLPDAAAARPPRDPAPPSREDAAWLRGLMIHRDDDILALNKPPGLPVQGGSKVERHLDAMLDALRFDAAERPRLVHRLDKETSGVLVLARSAAAAAWLARAFRGKDVVKTYWALVAGVPHPRRGRIDLAVGKRAADEDAGERVRPDPQDGKPASTLYAVVDHASSAAAWLALRPLTGRTHQLRVHCAALGTPILGDGKYGGPKAFLRGLPGGKVLQLHAYAITVPRRAGRPLTLAAPLSAEARDAWSFLGFHPAAWRDPFADN
jgi:23S rRNA pseudouridine955/2504/2580 synthase